MRTQFAKRILPLFLSFLMIVSMVPVQVFAADDILEREEEIVIDDADVTALTAQADEDAIAAYQAWIDDILSYYLGATDMGSDEIRAIVSEMDTDSIWMAQVELYDLAAEMEYELTEDEIGALVEANPTVSEFSTILDEYAAGVNLLTTVTVLDGLVSVTDSANSNTVSGGTVTITAKGSLFSKKTNNITITNESDSTAKLEFDYSASKANSFTVAGASATSGRYSEVMAPGASVKLVLVSNSGFSNTTATLTLSNFSLTAAASESNVTIDFDGALGSITADGAAVAAGDTLVVSLSAGVTLAAAANSGAAFLGWIDEDGAILSKEASYGFTPAEDMTVRAVFAENGGTPWFAVGAMTAKSVSSGLLGLSKINFHTVNGTHLFDDLNAAASAASGKAIVLMNNGTLPAGDYTIPAGATMLIPFDTNNTLYTTQVKGVECPSGNFNVFIPTEYRTLTMADGANLIINGALSLSAQHYYAQGSKFCGGSPAGNVSFIRMEGDSSITVNNGGALYAYGFITGDGTVTAKNGSVVYENFQIMDFRGGTQSTDMDNGVFPLSQYSVQNIEVLMTIEYGAKEYAYTTVYMSSSDFGSAVAFIAPSNAMFNMQSGYVTKFYDGSTDRLIVEGNGDVTVSSINMTVGTSSINSKNYELPITNNMTIKLNSGSITMNQDIAMLPGSEIYIGEDASCTLGSGNNIYVYDADDWGGYCGPGNFKFIPVGYAPGRTYTRTEADLVDAKLIANGEVDASAGYVYTTAGGAEVSGFGDVSMAHGTQKVTHQLTQAKDQAQSTYTAIPLTAPNVEGWTITHNYTFAEEITVPATCTEAGEKIDKCICGEGTPGVVDALGHTPATDAAVAPTCTETGLTEGSHCSVCNEILTAQEVVDALGHTPGAEPTCTTAQTCTVCGAELAAALGHTEVVDEAVAPTCTETGLTEGSHCSVCSEILTAQEVVDALGHSPIADANCTEASICSVCGETVADALGHTPAVDAAVAPTCTVNGLTEGSHCSVCGEVLTAQEVVPATGHTEVIDAAVEATCKATGLTEGSHCGVCGVTILAQVITPLKGHTLGEDATCTDAQTCTVCGTELEAALGHEYSDEVIAPTCTADGYTAHTCTRCGDNYTDSEVAALGHTEIVDEAVAPNCTEAGLTEGKHCEVCNEVLTAQEVVPALGHTEVIDAAVEATCTETGLTEGKHCSVCEEVLIAQEVVDALGHTEVVDAAVEATCTETGLTEGSHCDVCGEVFVAQEVVDALGHTEVIDEAVEPDCTETGLTEGSHCDVCGEVFVAQEVVDALGHTEVVDEAVEPTCTETGLTEGKHCEVCEEVLVAQEVVDVAPHEIVHFPAKAPTYTDKGYDAYDTCANCEYTTFGGFIDELGEPEIKSYEDFVANLVLLEEMAYEYVKTNPTKDPVALVIKYIRTGVERYNTGSWGIMAGYEDTDFAKYVTNAENALNAELAEVEGAELIAVTGLKNLYNFDLPNGDYVDFGHMFGAMDITYHNKGSVNHADVSGWAGDLVDLLEFSDRGGVSGTLDEMVADISANYFLKTPPMLGVSGFNHIDVLGDLDAFYVMETLYASEYETGALTQILVDYFTEDLDEADRADFFLRNRLNGASTRGQVRDAVYNAYTGNKVIATLEGTREFENTDISGIRRACCYVFADYLCKLAGDFVDVTDNPYYTVFSSETAVLAPGITQEIKYATSADNKQMVYYIATADITRDDVNLYANYNNNDPAAGWAMQRVLDQANAAQEKYGNPDSEYYVPNYNVIVSTNGAGFNMQTGEPGGLLVMGGVEYHPIDGHGFFGILKDGTPVIGTTEEYNTIYKGQVAEAIAGFGSTLVKDGEICVSRTENYYTSRASRTAVGITSTGKVVLMVLDGRQEPWSCGGSMEEIAQIMLEAGCVEAINLDGGGSTTFVAKQEGEDELSVVNRPSDGVQRSVSTSWMMVSTAPSSTAFDHAKLESPYNYATIGTPVQITAVGISATGQETDLPEGITWAVSDEKFASVTEDGVFTGLRNGSVEVYLMLGDSTIGSMTMTVTVPDTVYFTRASVDAIYGSAVKLPVAALFENKKVAISESDVVITLSNETAGTVEGTTFTGIEASGVKVVKATVTLTADSAVTGTVTINLYRQGENSFDFDKAIGGDRQLAWDRQVSNSATDDAVTYTVVNTDEDMVTSYIFAMDMSEIPIPAQLSDLVYMLPGADMENASAWNFLLQLAERVSVLTEVTPVLHFDKNFDVDYSELVIMNDYFVLEGKQFDEETNTLTLTLNWVDQTQAIDPATANPLCLVKGVKLTPKADASWSAKNSLTAVHSGEISYNIYLRANALYSFAQKPENQVIYGLQPFVNPNLPSESGAYFGDVYKEFEDTYTLVNAVKSGWVVEDGGYAYYVDGERLTGINEVEGYYYDFGENGINVGQTKFTGLIENEDKTEVRYAKFGELLTGWQQIQGEQYYFDNVTKFAVNGEQKLADGYTYVFEDYVLVRGEFVTDANGIRYRWAGGWLQNMLFELDGKTYLAQWNYYLAVGVVNLSNSGYYYFDETGAWRNDYTGLVIIGDKTYYVGEGIAKSGLIFAEDGYYYYFTSSKNYTAVKNGTYYVSNANGLDLAPGFYDFDEEGRLIIEILEVKNGIYTEEDGTLAYYVNDVKQYGKGLIDIDGDLYYISSSGKVCTGSVWVSNDNGLGYAGLQEFDETGKMIIKTPETEPSEPETEPSEPETEPGTDTTEPEPEPEVKNGICAEADGTLAYYVNGVKQYSKGLIDIDGDLYYISSSGKVCTGKVWVTNDNGLGYTGWQEFDEAGKMIVETPETEPSEPETEPSEPETEPGTDTTEPEPEPEVKNGIYTEGDGTLVYYVNGVKQYSKGLIDIDGDLYYISSSGKVCTGKVWVTNDNGRGYTGWQNFDETGKMIIG